MESAVERLEAMFEKSEADLEYIEKRLKLDFINRPAEGGATEEKPAEMLENLRNIRAKHSELCNQLKEISAAHSQSISSIRTSLSSVSQILKGLQNRSELQVESLTEAEKEAANFLGPVLTDTQSQQQQQLSRQAGDEDDKQKPSGLEWRC